MLFCAFFSSSSSSRSQIKNKHTKYIIQTKPMPRCSLSRFDQNRSQFYHSLGYFCCFFTLFMCLLVISFLFFSNVRWMDFVFCTMHTFISFPFTSGQFKVSFNGCQRNISVDCEYFLFHIPFNFSAAGHQSTIWLLATFWPFYSLTQIIPSNFRIIISLGWNVEQWWYSVVHWYDFIFTS